MAGVKGRSGGARPGAGRKPNPPAKLNVEPTDDPLTFLLCVMNDVKVDARLRVRAAIAATQYVHAKKGEGGKKQAQGKAAEAAGKGVFAPSSAPLRLVPGKSSGG